LTEYVDIIKSIEEYTFYHGDIKVVEKVFPEAKAGNVVLLKDFDEKVAIYTGDFTGDKFSNFLSEHSVPTVTEITQKVIEMVFKGNARKGIFLFRGESDKNAKTMEEEYRKVAKELKSKDHVFVLSDIKEGWGQRVANYFGIEESNLPTIEYVEMKEEMQRYKHSGPITEAEIKKFIKDVKEGNVPRFLKSEPIPTENPGPVYKLVGKEFKKEVLDNNMDVIVKFYAPWCGHCKKLEPIYKSLAEAQSSSKNIKFMEIDSTKNDIEGHPINGFPVIKLFPGKDKSNVATYNGDRSEGDISKFLKEKCSHPIDIPELKPKDEQDKGKDDL
jgi:protein disulfide isomerase